jgi:hypothetical protein
VCNGATQHNPPQTIQHNPPPNNSNNSNNSTQPPPKQFKQFKQFPQTIQINTAAGVTCTKIIRARITTHRQTSPDVDAKEVVGALIASCAAFEFVEHRRLLGSREASDRIPRARLQMLRKCAPVNNCVVDRGRGGGSSSLTPSGAFLILEHFDGEVVFS